MYHAGGRKIIRFSLRNFSFASCRFIIFKKTIAFVILLLSVENIFCCEARHGSPVSWLGSKIFI